MSVITTEQTFDMLPYVVEIYEKIDLDSYRKDIQKKYKGKKVNFEELGIDLFVYIMKNFHMAKEEFFQVLSIAENKDVEEIKKQPLSETLNSLKTIFTDKDLMDFFKEAMS